MTKAQELQKKRKKSGQEIKFNEFRDVDMSVTLDTYYENLLSSEDIKKSVEEYGNNIDKITDEFKEKTKLKKQDMPILFLAILLQVGKVFLINYLTQIEKAGTNNKKEDMLHNIQNKVLNKFDASDSMESSKYYASMNHIITTKGVPYDATAYTTGFKNSNSFSKIFEGANHRFSTLGHDPFFGLIFGTANILTNTITCINKPIITTNHVEYDMQMKNPQIGMYASTIKTLERTVDRALEEPQALAAALIKQIIHIGTDLYTPCGIQLPGANLILSKTNTEKLTKYISTGDVIKFGVSSSLSILINYLISFLHGLFNVDKEEEMNLKLYSIRTKKIVLISDVIASGSSIIAAGITKDMKKLDIGGFAVTAYQLFTFPKIYSQIQYEFVHTNLSKIYLDKVKEVEFYYE